MGGVLLLWGAAVRTLCEGGGVGGEVKRRCRENLANYTKTNTFIYLDF